MKTRLALTCGLLMALVCALPTIKADPPAGPSTRPLGFVKGFTWGWWGTRGSYTGEAAAESMRLLAGNNVQYATIAFVAHAPAHNIPMIAWGVANPRMVSDNEIRHAIALARQNGLKVILKPAIDCLDGVWRARIEFTTRDGKPDEKAWAIWWESYEAFMLHYARIAQQERCEALVIGCELSSTERFADRWRALAGRIGQVYQGPLIYNTAHLREMEVTWWDAVDVIGVGVYYTVGTETDFSLETMLKSFQPHRDRLRTLSEKWRRPILFAEIGCRSATGSQVWPGDHTHWEWPANAQVQANFYEAALRTFWDEPWFIGYVWWDWPARLYPKAQAATDKQFYIYGKPAEELVKKWYGKERR